MFGDGMNPFEADNVVWLWQPYWTFLNPADGRVKFEFFDQYKNQLVILNFSSEGWNDADDYVYRQLKDSNVNFLLLTHDPEKHQRYPRMFYYPYWYHWTMVEGWPEWVEKNTDLVLNKNRQYSLGCLNGKPRNHRIANYLGLKKKPYYNNTCISFFQSIGSEVVDDFELTDAELAEWQQLEPTLPTNPWLTDHFVNVVKDKADLSLNSPQLVDSYLHLIVETKTQPQIFMSEKTWKPVVTAVPFLIWGNPKTVNFMRSIGVDTYDDVIDHKYYDTEKDHRQRLNKLHKVLDDLMTVGAEQVYNQLADRATANRIKFFNGEFDKMYLPAIKQAITQHL
jgi:hypothetical protein